MNVSNLIDTEPEREAFDKALIATGRFHERVRISLGLAPMPEDMQTDEHYWALGKLTLENIDNAESND